MVEASSFPAAPASVAVLFHPSAVPVLDVFRSLDRLDDQYDLVLLDEPERALATYTTPEAAKGIISDALLLAFALTRQRGKPFSYQSRGSRHGSMDEYCLMTLIGASRFPGSDLSLEAAAALGLVSLDFMASLVGEMIRQMDRRSLVFDLPTLPEFRAILGGEVESTSSVNQFLGQSGFQFRI